jgi:hypothetical protein
MDDHQLLIMMVPGELRDDVVDSLSGCEGISGFNMTTMAGFSKEHSQYDLREQVEGYRKFFKFEVMHARPQQATLLAVLRPVCSSANIRYWIVPVLEQGHI